MVPRIKIQPLVRSANALLPLAEEAFSHHGATRIALFATIEIAPDRIPLANETSRFFVGNAMSWLQFL
jgi:hypothetical protein